MLCLPENDFQGLALSKRTDEIIYADASAQGQRIEAVSLKTGQTRTIAAGIYPTALAVDDDSG